MWSAVFDADHGVVVSFFSFLHWEHTELSYDFKCSDESSRVLCVYPVVRIAVFFFELLL